MLCEFCEPGVRDKNALLPLVVCLNTIPLLLGICDYILHVLVLQGTKDAKEEVTLRELA